MLSGRLPSYRGISAALVAATLTVASCSRRNAADRKPNTEAEHRSPSGITVSPDSGTSSWRPESEIAAVIDLPAAQRGVELLRLYRLWGSSDGESAVIHAATEGESIASASLREAFGGWLSSDAEGAKAWVRDQPTGRNLTKFAGALGEALDGPEARATWAAGLSDKSTKRQLLSRVMSEWGRSDSAMSAIAWLEDNGGLEKRTSELGQLVRAWCDHDGTAASEALVELPAGSARDAAVAALVTVIAPDQGEAALTWAETIDDKQKRTELLALVAKIGGSGGTETLAP